MFFKFINRLRASRLTYLFNFRIGLAHIARVGSVFVTVSVSVERYLSVRHPNNTFSIKKWLLPLPIAFAVIYNLPKFFEFVSCDGNSSPHLNLPFHNVTDQIRIIHAQKNADNLTQPDWENGTLSFDDVQNVLKQTYFNRKNISKGPTANLEDCVDGEYRVTRLRKNRWYIIFYVFGADFILVEIVPWIIIIMLNLLTWRGIQQFQKKRKRLMKTHSPGNPNIVLFCNILNIYGVDIYAAL